MTKKYPPQEAAASEPAPSEPDFLDKNPEPQAGAGSTTPEAKKQKPRYICCKSAPFGTRHYEPGQYLETDEGVEVPRQFMPCTMTGPNGTVETGPYFFALRDCQAPDGREFKAGEIFNSAAFLGLPPEGMFAPLEQRGDYEWQDVSGVRRVYLRRKPPESPTTPAA